MSPLEESADILVGLGTTTGVGVLYLFCDGSPAQGRVKALRLTRAGQDPCRLGASGFAGGGWAGAGPWGVEGVCVGVCWCLLVFVGVRRCLLVFVGVCWWLFAGVGRLRRFLGGRVGRPAGVVGQEFRLCVLEEDRPCSPPPRGAHMV